MEIHKDSNDRKVYFELPVLPEDNTVEVKLTKNGTVVYTFNTVEYDAGRYSVTIPFRFVGGDAEYELQWKVDYVEDGLPDVVERTVPFSVVTPYLTIPEVKKIWAEATDEQAREVEAAVRAVINAHTGQSFGYGLKTLTVEGHGERALRLPERLVELLSLSTLTATLNTHRAIVTSDGWYLKKGWTDDVSVLQSTDEYFLGESQIDWGINPGEPGYEKSSHGPIIVAPGASGSPTRFRDDYPFRITGWWGYKSVPLAVKEAAKLLVNDYACSEAIYRDRYLEAIKAADWRLQFSSRAWDHTGNARADHLLSEFVLADWAVI